MEVIADAAASVDATTIGKPRPLESVETKTAVILVNSTCGSSAAGIFKFNIHIIKDDSSAPPRFVVSCDKDEEKDSIIKTEEQDQSPFLSPLESFFDQTPEQLIYRCAFFRKPESPEELYLIPMDTELSPESRKSLSPLQYNFRTNETQSTPFPLPSVPKLFPIAAYIKGKIFLLSCAAPLMRYPQPNFESYSTRLELNEWLALPSWYRCSGDVSGYIVLRDQFIVVGLDLGSLGNGEHVFYSYNTVSGSWKRVKQKPPPSDVSGKYFVHPQLFREGLAPFVSGDVESRMIYSYDPTFSLKLIAFSYSLEMSGDHDLSFDLASYVKGFKAPDRRVKFPKGYYPSDYSSGALSKLSDNDCSLLCVLHLYPCFYCDPFKESSVSIIKLDDDDHCSCTLLATFRFNLSLGDLLESASIQSFFFIQLAEQKEDRPSKRLKDDVALKEEINIDWTSEDADEMEV